MSSHLILILCFFCSSCIEKRSNTNLQSNKSEKITIQITNNYYHLDLVTEYKKDTLNVIDWEEDKYSNPIIIKQVLKFYNQTLLIKEHELPIKSIPKETIKGKVLSVPYVPIINICYHKGVKSDYFIVSGSDFCMGVTCPEFTGIYQMNGSVLFEAISTESKDKFKKLVKVIELTGIEINNPNKCMSLIKDKRFWDK